MDLRDAIVQEYREAIESDGKYVIIVFLSLQCLPNGAIIKICGGSIG
jgi:hypothetical protein